MSDLTDDIRERHVLKRWRFERCQLISACVGMALLLLVLGVAFVEIGLSSAALFNVQAPPTYKVNVTIT